MHDVLFSPLTIGKLRLKNRIVMAPMTRSRANQGDDNPTAMMQDYYRQRASAGLIVSEGLHPCADGKGYCRTPGLYTEQHAQAWRKITDAVHQKGGLIAAQLMHCGRVGHALNKANDTRALAPSAVAADAQMHTEQGMQALTTPVAMTEQDIRQTLEHFINSAKLAKIAGFDAIELHCTSGYLPAQFMATGSNQRQDEYGGAVENRIKFVLEVLQRLVDVMGEGRVGIRICPGNPFNGLYDGNPAATHKALLQKVEAMKLAYVHVIRSPVASLNAFALVKENYTGVIITNDSYSAAMAEIDIESGTAHAVSFGRDFIANPDLPDRIKEGAPLVKFDSKSLYGNAVQGYCDYPDRFGEIG